MNITRQDLVDMISEKMPELEPEKIADIVNRLFEQIIEELKNGKKIEFRNFGRFKCVERRGRIGHNPKTLVKVNVPAKKVPVFKIGKLFKEEIEHNRKDKTDLVAKALASRLNKENKI